MNNDSQKPKSVTKYLREVFGVDTRSLAILRIAIALIIIFNLLTIIGDLPAFYLESGVLPLEMNQQVAAVSGDGYWSALWLSDSSNWTWVCVGVTAVAAVSLLFGFYTTIATAISLIMVWSFQVRNPLVLTAGDILLRMVLVWCLFLPWGRVWSIDGRKSKGAPKRVTSFASAGLLLQLAYIYFFSGIAKYNGSWSGSALIQTLNLEMYVNEFGSWLGGQIPIHDWIAIGVLVVEIVGPVILFLPKVNQFWRGMMMALMWIMHLMIALSMSIGIFSVVAMVTWFAFIPGSVWNMVLGPPDPMERSGQSMTGKTVLQQVVCAVLLVFALLLNVDKVGVNRGRILPSQVDDFATTLMIQQEFKMFANPPTTSPWPQYLSTLKNGEVVDLFEDVQIPFSGKKPDSVYRYMKSQSWRRYHFNLIHQVDTADAPPIFQQVRKQMLKFQIEKWGRRANEARQVLNASLVMHFDKFDEAGKPNGNSTQQLWAEITNH